MRTSVNEIKAGCKILAGRSGLKRIITSPQVVASDLSSGATVGGWASVVLHIRPSQLAYLGVLPRAERTRLARVIMKQKPACILVSGGRVCKDLLERAEASKIPVLKTGNLRKLARLLVESVTPRVSLHGVLVQIFGMGTLLLGESGIGKSEAALDLVLRGHKLIADDVVILEKTGHELSGRPLEMGADLLQIRGLGVINIRDLYGETATSDHCVVGLVVELEERRKDRQYSLIGLREQRYRILGLNLPYVKLPVHPGQSMATLIEVAARNQTLKQRGIFTARDFNRRIKKRLVG